MIQWYLNGDALMGQTNSLIIFEEAGVYTVSVSNGSCQTISDEFVVLSIAIMDKKIQLFPNPVLNKLRLDIPSVFQKEINYILVRDLTGKEIQSTDFNHELDVSTLESGMYILSIKSEQGEINRRFVKE